MKQGEVWLINFNPKVGQEIDKIRPGIVASHDTVGSLRLKIVVPITTGLRNIQEWHVPLLPSSSNNLEKDSVADCFQLKSLSRERFIRMIGMLSEAEMDDVKFGMMKVLGMLK